MSDHRHSLVTERTILVNWLRWHLHELDPNLQVPSRGLRRYRVLDDLAAAHAFDDVEPASPPSWSPAAGSSPSRSMRSSENSGSWCAAWLRRCWPCLAAACLALR
jgi:hypothetical protein